MRSCSPFVNPHFRSNDSNEVLTLDYSVNPSWLVENCGQDIIYGDELDCYKEEVITVDESDNSSLSSNENITIPTADPRSILIPQKEAKFKQTLTINRSLLKSNQRKLEAQTSTESYDPTNSSDMQNNSKFRQKVNCKPTNFVLNEHTMKIFKNKIKAIHKRKAQAVAREKKQRPNKLKQVKFTNVPKKAPVKKPEAVNYISQKPKPIVDPRNSGEIVRVQKAESDIEVDILSNSEEDLIITESYEDDTIGSIEEISVDDSESSWMNDDKTLKRLEELKETDESTSYVLESLEVPHAEILLEAANISNLERFLHSEFFIQRPTKTPERYLKIRNHIIAMWNQFKPNYLSKTTARNGLKKCGDVNCISRIFSTLEQIGAINFNCQEVRWIRPLKVLYTFFQQNISNKNLSSRIGPMFDKKQRIRNSSNIVQDANFTISHDGNTLMSSESSDSMINRIKSRTMHRTQFELIKTHCFSKDNAAPFQVSISLSCLMCLYLHALSSRLEIMGFLGGKCVGQDKLTLTRYKPCKTSNQSAINCEMCPVSQVEQSCNLIEEGYELLGWFHSHPNFPPIPSRTDLKTQAEMQLQFASNNPFIGFIISCVDMEFK